MPRNSTTLTFTNRVPLKALLFTLLLMPGLAMAIGLKTLDGEPQKLKDHLGDGQWTVVKIWAHNCHICNQEAPKVQAFHERMQKAGLARVVGISVDGEENVLDAEHYLEKHGLDNTNLITEPMSAAILLANTAGARFVGTPTYLVFDREGNYQAGDAGAVPMSAIEKFIRDNDGDKQASN